MTLLAGVNRPESQEDVVGNWEPAHSLVKDAVSGAKIAAAPCLLALAVACPPLCLWVGDVQNSEELHHFKEDIFGGKGTAPMCKMCPVNWSGSLGLCSCSLSPKY